MDESQLLSKLESYRYIPFFQDFRKHLEDFRISQELKIKFVNDSISIIRKRLSDASTLEGILVFEFVRTFNLCLDRLESVTSQLPGEMFKPTLHRLNLIRCLQERKMYTMANTEGMKMWTVFSDLSTEKNIKDNQFDRHVIEVVLGIVKNVSLRVERDPFGYVNVLEPLKKFKGYFRLDDSASNKLHDELVVCLDDITRHLVGHQIVSYELVKEFCEISMKEHTRSTTKKQTFQFAREICCILFLLSGEENEHILAIFECILRSLLSICKVVEENDSIQLKSFLFDIVDFAALGGSKELYHKLYKIVGAVYKRKKEQENFLSMMWQSRRLRHPLCIAPVCDELLNNLSEVFGGEVKNTDFWKKCLAKPIELDGFRQMEFCLLINPDSDTMKAIERLASQLKVQPTSDALFFAGCLYDELSEKQIATGNLSEAINYAKEAYRLHGELFQKTYPSIYNLLEKRPVVYEMWYTDRKSSDGETIYLNPWKLLGCYLESTLRFGIVQEMIGNTREAAEYLLRGKVIAFKQNLPLFSVSFSIALGKLYRKMQYWTRLDNELLDAVVKLSKSNILCRNCGQIMRVCVDMEYAEWYQRSSVHCDSLDLSSFVDKHPYQSSYSILESELRQEVEDKSNEVTPGLPVSSNTKKGKKSEKKSKEVIRCEKCNGMNCLFCLALEAKESKSLIKLISLKWELCRRKLFLWVLSVQGKYLESNDLIVNTYLQSLKTLALRCPFTRASTVTFSNLLDFVVLKFPKDVCAIDLANLLYRVCWFLLKNYISSDSRTTDHELSQLENVFPLLIRAFVLCIEVPLLVQKVSRLLCVICTVSSSRKLFSLPFKELSSDQKKEKKFSECHWASYFHQISLNGRTLFQMQGPEKAESCSFASLALKLVGALEPDVRNFFSEIPCCTIICVSLVGGRYKALLQNLLQYSSGADAWMLLSRLNFQSSPLMMLLPLNKEDKAAGGCSSSSNMSVLDEVVPSFKGIMDKNNEYNEVKRKIEYDSWLVMTKSLDNQLRDLLRELQDSWLGRWSYVLLGGSSNHKHLDSVQEKLMMDLKLRCKLEVSESIVRAFLGVENHEIDGKASGATLLLSKNNCFIGEEGYHETKMRETLSEGDGVAIPMILEAWSKFKKNFAAREPVILVLDSEMQRIPWESFPVLRTQEVYRMPSVESILDRYEQNQSFPCIDPRDAFFVLNPSTELMTFQGTFDEYFRQKKLNGTVGIAPTTEELSMHLKKHDLYLYLGHGSGEKYISNKIIENLGSEKCSAAVLMGCGSGSLTVQGSYPPEGAPLSYLKAGAPFVVANLWDLTEYDVNFSAVEFIKSLFRARSDAYKVCKQCEASDRQGQMKKEKTKDLKRLCPHKRKVGALICPAREKCTLPYLTGAATVCYGLPTSITVKVGDDILRLL